VGGEGAGSSRNGTELSRKRLLTKTIMDLNKEDQTPQEGGSPNDFLGKVILLSGVKRGTKMLHKVNQSVLKVKTCSDWDLQHEL